MWEEQHEPNSDRDDSVFRIHRCPRLNRRYGPAYRCFKVNPDQETTEQFLDRYEEPDDSGFELPLADEIEVEPVSGFEAGPEFEEVSSSGAVDSGAEWTDTCETREGLRRIFTTDSDLAVDAGQAEPPEGPDLTEPAPEIIPDGIRSDISQQTGDSRSIHLSTGQVTGPDDRDKKLVWKAFPKPLRRK